MKCADLFAGCGGLSKGLQNAGFEVVVGIEYWEDARSVYENNLHHECLNLDLSDVEMAVSLLSKMNLDMVVGGPPCLDYSSAGKRTEGTRANLTVSYGEILRSVRPTWIVMENVPLTRKSHSYSLYRQIVKEAGYGLTEVVLDASFCGVPQSRKRFFSIGKLGEDDGFLSDIIDSEKSENPMTVRDYFGDELDVEHYYRHPRSYQRRGVYSVDEPSATIRGVNRPLPSGYPGHHLDSTKNLSKVRPLTTKERAMIQTFPEDFIFSGSKSAQEQMIGNAVPVNLGAFVGRCVMKYHQTVQTTGVVVDEVLSVAKTK